MHPTPRATSRSLGRGTLAHEKTATPTAPPRVNMRRVVAERIERLLPAVRRYKARANEAAVTAERFEDILVALLHATLAPEPGSEELPLIVDPPRNLKQEHEEILHRIAGASPIESLGWRGPVGRRLAVTVNTTEVTLPKRLATILEILHQQPSAPDGFPGFIDYAALRKEVARREARRVRLRSHSLSQSLGLLAGEFEAQGLNKSWIHRDTKRRRVRLLIRKPIESASSGTASADGRGDRP